jgi:NAD(P)-dependent dehydrogenase (short-subunit alcohol dehydrogenase family)
MEEDDPVLQSRQRALSAAQTLQVSIEAYRHHAYKGSAALSGAIREAHMADARMADSNFADGVAIVAGGSGGIGREICRVLAEAGSHVALTYRSKKEAADDAVAAVKALGMRAEAAPLALEDAEATAAYVNGVAERFGRVHSIVYAAGPPLSFGYAAAIKPAEWKRVMDVDVNGCFNFIFAAMPHLKRQGAGALVALITSAVEKVPMQDILSAAPKAAIEMLVRGIAKEEGRYGVRANCVGPGFIDAGLGAALLNKEGGEKFAEMVRRSLPMKRFGSAREIAEAVVFLLSSKASYITGQSLAVDGGLQL